MSFISTPVQLSDLDGTNGFTLQCINENDQFGFSVSSAGDFNGDSFSDVIVGANQADPNGQVNAGEGYIVFGGKNLDATFETSTLDSSNGIRLRASTGDKLGQSVSTAGDMNGDGFDDVIISAYNATVNASTNAGKVYVIFGAETAPGTNGVLELSNLSGEDGFVMLGTSSDYRVGFFVSAAGDINRDGFDDIIMSAKDASPNGLSNAGQRYVVFGAAGVGSSGRINLSALSGSDGFIINDKAAFNIGRAVSKAGDVNGDNFDDLLLGSQNASPGGKMYAGQSYVVFGSTTVGSSGVFELSDLNGENGFQLNGIAEDDKSGKAVGAAGDINGDNIDDIIIGASQADPNAKPSAGQSYVVFGKPTIGSTGVIHLSNLNGNNGFAINGAVAYDYFGNAVKSAGDWNGDGIDDLIIGAYYAKPNGIDYAGKTYLIFGSKQIGSSGIIEVSSLTSAKGVEFQGIALNDLSGVSVSGAGDVDGDGLDDIIIGSRFDSSVAFYGGASYVIYGTLPSPQGRGIMSLATDSEGDVFQLNAATLTTNNVALVWTQPRAWASSTGERSQLDGYIVKPANVPKQITQQRQGPYNGASDEEYVRITRIANNRFVMAWEDQSKDTTTNKRFNTVFVQAFTGNTGKDLNKVFEWDTTQKKYKPDIAYVTTMQVVVVYETATKAGVKQVKLIRLRATDDGSILAVGKSAVVAQGTKPRVQRTSAGGFFVAYRGTDGKYYIKTYDNTNTVLAGPFVVGGASEVAYLSENGRIVVVWGAVNKVYYRMYDSVTGKAKTAKLAVNSADAASIQTNPAIISLSGGGFMITWQQQATSTSDNDIMACQFTSTGAVVDGNPFGVHSAKTTGEQTRPTLTEIDGEAVLFAWNLQNTGVTASKVNYQIFDLPSTALSRQQMQLRDIYSSVDQQQEQETEAAATTLSGSMMLSSILGRLFA